MAADRAWRAGASSPHLNFWLVRSDRGCRLAFGSEQRDPVSEIPEAPLAQDMDPSRPIHRAYEFEDCDNAEDEYDPPESAQADEDWWTQCAGRD